MNIQFDELTHTYTVDGVIYPSVTQIINAVVRPFYPAQGMQWYKDRGRAIHMCMQYLMLGVAFDYDKQIAGFVDAGRKWIDDYQPEWVEVENQLASRFGYCGTLDLSCWIQKCGVTIVDYKSGICNTAMWQTAGYSALYKENTGETAKTLMSVRLKEDGNYDVKWWDAKRMEREWMNILSVYKIMKREGMIK